jgi:hypothetical protein
VNLRWPEPYKFNRLNLIGFNPPNRTLRRFDQAHPPCQAAQVPDAGGAVLAGMGMSLAAMGATAAGLLPAV